MKAETWVFLATTIFFLIVTPIYWVATASGRYLDGNGGRERAGLMSGGPSAVVTNLAMMRFDEKTREMYLATY